MAKPANRSQFREYCLRALGKGVLELNMDPDQIEDRIDEALEYWQTFHHDATIRTYMKYQLTPTDITNKYIPVNDDVVGVTRIFRTNGSSGAGYANMFSFEYQWRLNDFVTYRATPQLLDYYLIGTYMQQIDDMFHGDIGITFNRHTDRVYLHWDWDKDAVAGQYIILETLVALDGEEFTQMWGDRMLQKYCTALLKRQWGNNMKKFVGVQLLGGIALDGQTIYNEAMEEIEALEEKIRSEFEEPPRFFTG